MWEEFGGGGRQKICSKIIQKEENLHFKSQFQNRA
jgi:hypothetical protein